MNYDQPLKSVEFDRFNLEQQDDYKKALNPQNALIFHNSADLFEEVENWLQEQYPGGEFGAGRGKGRLANAVIVTPKITAEVNKDFSKDVHESKLAKKKSKLGPQ